MVEIADAKLRFRIYQRVIAVSDASDTDRNKKPSPVRKSKGVSRRLDRETGKWTASDSNTALLAAMVKALRPRREAKR